MGINRIVKSQTELTEIMPVQFRRLIAKPVVIQKNNEKCCRIAQRGAKWHGCMEVCANDKKQSLKCSRRPQPAKVTWIELLSCL